MKKQNISINNYYLILSLIMLFIFPLNSLAIDKTDHHNTNNKTKNKRADRAAIHVSELYSEPSTLDDKEYTSNDNLSLISTRDNGNESLESIITELEKDGVTVKVISSSSSNEVIVDDQDQKLKK